MDIVLPGGACRPTLAERSAISEEIHTHGLAYLNKEDDDLLLCWGRDDTAHPRNWSTQKKAYNAFIIIFLDFFVTGLATIGSAAVDHASGDYNISQTMSIFAYTSLYLFSQIFGGLVFPPISETYGRKTLYVTSTLIISASCVLVAAVPSVSGVFVGRIISGFFSAVPSIVTAGTVEDIFDSEARVWITFTWGCATNLGVVFGPLYGTFLSESLGWRWAFYVAAIITGLQGLLCLTMSESRPSLLLERKLKIFHKATGRTEFKVWNPDSVLSYREFLNIGIYRPVQLLLTEPIVWMVSIMSSIAFGQIYMLTEAIPIIYQQFGFDRSQQSLAFLPIGIGFLLGGITRFYDMRLIKKIKASGRALTPEDKMRGFSMGAPVLAISLWWFAWATPPHFKTHWIVSMIPLMGVGFATTEFDCTLAGYLTDSYTMYTASAFAALEILRSSISGGLPLFTPQMYQALDPNKATSLLAVIATLFCVTPYIFAKYGAVLRYRSKFAKYSEEASTRIGGMGRVQGVLLVVEGEGSGAVTGSEGISSLGSTKEKTQMV